MKIVADENIPLLTRFFGDIGNITAIPGRSINAVDVKDADILIVRSVTQVNKALLEGSSVKFVGTCTIGTDHVDIAYLEEKGICFSNAPGCNANSVVEYVLSCLSILTETHNIDLEKHKVGIVGYGNVGSLLAARLTKMGVPFVACDPFLDQDEHQLVPFEDILECDIISLHVPLTHDGPHPTYHMFDESRLSGLSSEQILMNTCRGDVVDNQGLKSVLSSGKGPSVILDVWENEPSIDAELLKLVFLGTPHIAGYSFDGKVNGTEIVYRALCQFLGLPARHKAGQFLEEPPLSKMAFTSMADPAWCVHTAIRACFDVRHDDSNLRSAMRLPEDERNAMFDRLRKEYRCRREFSGTKVQLKKADSELHTKFKALGFNVKN